MAEGLSAFSFDFFLNNWNNGIIGTALLIVLFFLISGYFYGRAYEKLFPVLKNMDCTFLGVFTILSVFEICFIVSIYMNLPTTFCYTAIKVAVCAGPVLALITRANVIPTWKNLISVALGILITMVLFGLSVRYTTNNIYFDSITYLSQAIDTSVGTHFLTGDYTHGWSYVRMDPLHDLNGYSFFWGLVMRYAKETFKITENLIPVYLWGGCAFYGMSLGNLITSSVLSLTKKKMEATIGLIAGTLILSPYLTNYFNADLSFFGNTVRPVVLGFVLLVIYHSLRKEQPGVFTIVFILQFAGICVSSSSLFLFAMALSALFFALCLRKETNLKTWMMFIFGCFPTLFYGLLCTQTRTDWKIILLICLVVTAVLLLVAWLIRDHLELFCKIGLVLLSVLFIALTGVSYLKSSGEYGYAYFFEPRSLNDMMVNVTSWLSKEEMMRNIILYILLALLFVNFHKNKLYKVYLLILGILFLNPLVQPAISTYLTSEAYQRSFDLLTNPFTLLFLVVNAIYVLKLLPLKISVLPAVGVYSLLVLCNSNFNEIYSRSMLPNPEDYNEVYKVSNASLEMYEYIQQNMSDEQNRPLFLSQDVGMKGYVSNVYTAFSSSDYRDVLANGPKTTAEKYIISILYPETRFTEMIEGNDAPQPSQLQEIIMEYPVEYIVMSNTMAVWDERGWYDKFYIELERNGLVSVQWENPTWVILKVDQDVAEQLRTGETLTEETNEENNEGEPSSENVG